MNLVALIAELRDLLLVLLGAALALLPMFVARHKRLKAHRGALRAEIMLCVEHAEAYLAGPILAPAYRAPMAAHSAAFPALLADGALNEDRVMAIERFYGEVEAFNRTLDFAHDARNLEGNRLDREASRVRLKAQNVIDKKDAALRALRKGRPKKSPAEAGLSGT